MHPDAETGDERAGQPAPDEHATGPSTPSTPSSRGEEWEEPRAQEGGVPPAAPHEPLAPETAMPDPAPETYVPHAAPSATGSFAAIGLIGVLLLAAGGVGYGFWSGSLALPGAEEPPLARMVAAMSEVETYEFDVTASVASEIELPASSGDPEFDAMLEGEVTTAEADLSVVGVVDARDAPNSSMQATVEARAGVEQGFMSMRFGIGADLVIDRAETAYLRLSEVPAPLAMMGLAALEGQWIAQPIDTAGDTAGAVAPLPVNSLTDELSAEERAALEAELRSYLDENPVLSLGEPREEVSAPRAPTTPVLAYPLQLDREAAVDFLVFAAGRLAAVLGEEPPNPTEVAEGRQALLALMESFTAETAELWIGQEDDLLYRVLVEGSFAPTEELMAIVEEDGPMESPGEFVSTTYTLDAQYGAFNEAVTIEVPENARTLEAIMQEEMERRQQEFDAMFEDVTPGVEGIDPAELSGTEVSEREAGVLQDLVSGLPLDELSASLGGLVAPQ